MMVFKNRQRTFEAKQFKPGDECTVTNDGGLFTLYEARQFIGAECIFVKRTKSGLIQVALKADAKQTYSVPMCNIRTADGLKIMVANIKPWPKTT